MHEVACDVCGSWDRLSLFDRGRNNKAVSNVICKQCGLVFVSPREKGDVEKLYAEGEFSVQARGGHVPDNAKVAQLEQQALERFRRFYSVVAFESNSPGEILEIGCSLGSFLRLMRGAGWQVNGLEPDTGYAKFGEQAYDLSIRSEMYETAEFSAESFDFIALFHVIEHVKSPRHVFTKISRELKTNGYLYVECPCIERPLKGNLEGFFWDCHFYTFSKNTLLGLLEELGFESISCGYSGNGFWAIVKKMACQPNISHESRYPLDDPNVVLSRTHALYEQHLRTSRVKTGRWRLINRAVSLVGRGIVKLKNDPSGFVPTVTRKFADLGGRLAQRPAVKRMTRALKSRRVFHFQLLKPGNAGDTLLFPAVRKLVNEIERQHWELEPLRAEVTQQMVAKINAAGKAVLLGGGGLFLRDTNPNQASGWQWNCSIANLKKIEVPIILFAVGYNRFRGQEEFDPIFKDHLNELVHRSPFVGLRNHGSVISVSNYLAPELASKLRFQPCPTTLLRCIYPNLMQSSKQHKLRRLAVNAAFDRHELRFDDLEREILTSLARVMKWADQAGWEVILAVHSGLDATIIPWLLREKVNFKEVCLEAIPAKEVVRFYRDVDLAVGMRGHAQLIPFGVGVPIISLISHDKLAWFLEDIGHTEWGIEVKAPDFEEALKQKIMMIGDDLDPVRRQLEEAQAMLWQTTQKNLATIRNILN